MSAKAPTYGPLIETLCPTCGYQLTAATKVVGEEGAPEAGDVSICLNCGELLIYREDLTQRKATVDEMRSMQSDRDGWTKIEKARMLIWQRGRFR